MGPKIAAQKFLSAVEGVKKFEVTLYGSLAATGKGHLTDKAILSILEPVAPTVIKWKPDVFLKFHPNGMNFKAFGAENYLIKDWTVFSIGGGDLAEEGKTDDAAKEVYEMRTIAEIQQWCEKTGKGIGIDHAAASHASAIAVSVHKIAHSLAPHTQATRLHALVVKSVFN